MDTLNFAQMKKIVFLFLFYLILSCDSVEEASCKNLQKA